MVVTTKCIRTSSSNPYLCLYYVYYDVHACTCRMVHFTFFNVYLTTQVQPVDWASAEASLQVDCSVKEVAWATPGTTAGMAMLEEFCSKRLKNFDKCRNDPASNGLSNLSPWFHFGKVF